MNKNYIYACMLTMALLSCKSAPKEAYFNRGDPESLLDLSSEVVNLKIVSPASVQELTDIVNKEQPTRAEVSCQEFDSLCKEVKNVMHQFGVTVKYTSSPSNNVALVYERILARDCQNRYINNTNDLNNLNAPTLGCSTAINIVQMVTDKHQFTNPSIMDVPGANKAMQAAGNYNTLVKPDTSFPVMVEGASSGSSR